MRIAVSTPVRWATLLAALATLALSAGHGTHARAATPVARRDADPNRAARAGLSQIERDLDALTDRVTSAVYALEAAQSEADVRVANAELLRLRAEVAAERRLLAERARQFQPTLAR